MNRNSTFDIIKGIGIILVVLGHCGFIFSNFIYLFHMPLFFIVSGYFFKETNYDNLLKVRDYLKRKIKQLYLPYIITNLFFLYCTNIFIKLNFYSARKPNDPLGWTGYDIVDPFNIKLYFFKTFQTLILYLRELISGPTWFLKVLFFITIFSCLIHYLCKKSCKTDKQFQIIRFFISLSVFLVGYILQILKFNFYQIGTILTCSMFFYMGILYQQYQEKIKINLITFFISFTILIIFCFIQYPYRTEIYINSYYNPFSIILTSALGFYFLLSISKFLNRNKKITDIIGYIGENTLWILCLHPFFFKCLTLIHIHLYKEPITILYKHSVDITTHDGWWILYTIIGIIGPLTTKFYVKKIIKFIKILN